MANEAANGELIRGLKHISHASELSHLSVISSVVRGV